MGRSSVRCSTEKWWENINQRHAFYEGSTYQCSFKWSKCKVWVRFQQSLMHLVCIHVSALLNSYVRNSMSYEIAAWWAVRKSYPNIVLLSSCTKEEFKHRYTTLKGLTGRGRGKKETLACLPHNSEKCLCPLNAASDWCWSVNAGMFCLCVLQINMLWTDTYLDHAWGKF